MISPKAIREFKELWLAETGEEIDDQKALAEATRLLVFFDAIYRPLKKEWTDERHDDENHGSTL